MFCNKNMKKIIKVFRIFLLSVIPFLTFNVVQESLAATGDIIATDLLETASVGPYGTRTIQSTGCAPSGTGQCIMMDCVTGVCTGNDLWSIDIPDSPEITIVWDEKYSVWPLADANCKSIRPYTGVSTYMAALITAYFNESIYISNWDSAEIQPTTAISDMWETPPHTDGCTTSDYITYICAQGVGSGKLKMSLSSPMGTEWNKMRYWIKMPTNYSSGDGEIKLWKNEILQFHLYNIDMSDAGLESPVTTHINFAPVDESTTPHEHWYDEITVYEGLVEPIDLNPPSLPIGLSVL